MAPSELIRKLRGRYRHALASVALAATAGAAATLAVDAAPSAASSLNQLNSALSADHARQQQVSTALALTGRQVKTLTGQVSLIDSRLAGVQSELGVDQARVRDDAVQVMRERAAARRFERRLSRARINLAHQLVSRYEAGPTSLVAVVLESKGFEQLLENVNFIGRAEQEEQSLLKVARTDKARADAAAMRATKLRDNESKVAAVTQIQERSLAGMQTVLSSRQDALAHARAAQSAALAAARSRGTQLTTEISHVKTQEAAAQAAARALSSSSTQTAATTGQTTTGTGTADNSDAYGEWAIPATIVMCESGGQNDPPNSAGASGYYQIIPSTWTGFGGTGPAAYLASKQEQDAVAARIWRGGAGASDWVCAGIVGIS
jgi:peptidoglycan hydrolase CwlO-like protein